MKRLFLILGACFAAAPAHDIITTPITYTREIARIMQARCWSCHREGGTAFSLMTYSDARPWAEAVKEEVLARTMPPWGAVKGFGDFRNDQALTPEQIEVIESWADGGVPEGEPGDLPPGTTAAKTAPNVTEVKLQRPHGTVVVRGEFKLPHAFTLDGVLPEAVPEKASIQITAELPDGEVEPLIWLQDYKPKYAHPFLLRTPIALPAGTLIHGVPAGAAIALLAAPKP
jgi:hypothetical protein